MESTGRPISSPGQLRWLGERDLYVKEYDEESVVQLRTVGEREEESFVPEQ